MENQKFKLKETKDKEKPVKIIGKKVLAKGKIQVNLSDGRNFIAKEKEYKTNDTVVIGLDGKIIKIIQLKDGAKVMVAEGKHAGKIGKVEKINEEGKIATIKLENSKINLNVKMLMAI